MVENSKIQQQINSKRINDNIDIQTSNPLSISDNKDLAITNYVQVLPRQKYDKDLSEILEVVRILNNMVPIRMPSYNFNLNEINGDHYYKPDGTLLLVREYDGDVIRDYYVEFDSSAAEQTISRILEHDKTTGRLRSRIEPIKRQGSRLKTNITIFDLKVNNKYIIIQLVEDGIVNNISEFTDNGKSFQTLFRNTETFKPVRYLEGRDNKDKGFGMVDCIFDSEGNVVKIKRYANKKEVTIDYTQESKNITVNAKV